MTPDRDELIFFGILGGLVLALTFFLWIPALAARRIFNALVDWNEL